MKITKIQLKEWIKEALNELDDEESSEEEPSQVEKTDKTDFFIQNEKFIFIFT